MISELNEFDSYTAFSSRVRGFEAQTRMKGDQQNIGDIDEYLRGVMQGHDLEIKLKILCACVENSRTLKAHAALKSRDILDLCAEFFIANKGVSPESTSSIYVIKLVGLMHTDTAEIHESESSRFVTHLLDIMNSERIKSETGLLCGNAVILVMLKIISREMFADELKKILISNSKEFSTMCILTGLFSVGKKELFLSKETSCEDVDTMPLDMELVNNLLFSHLESILKLCYSTSSLTYQNFSLLGLWSTAAKEVSMLSGTADKLDISTSLVHRIIQICQGNFENQAKGVSDLCKNIYRDALFVVEKACGPEYNRFIKDLISTVMNTKWSNKAKYFQLSALVPILGVEKTVELYPKFGDGLVISLRSNHLTHAGADVYKIFLSNEELWEQNFAKVLADSLISSDQITRQNARDHWLPATLKIIPNASKMLNKYLKELADSFQAFVLVQLDILKISKKLGSIETLDKEQECHLNAGLVHPSPDVRAASFSLVCETKKRGTPPSATEMNSLLAFFSQSITDDSPKFRQCVLSAFSLLMIRCRDFSSQQLRKDVKGGSHSPALIEMVQFLDKLMKLLVDNLYPGGNYQRKILSLHFLNIFIDNFVNFSNSGANKCSGNGDPANFIQFAHSNDLLVFLNNRVFQVVLLNVEDRMGDVRELSGNILKLFTPSPGILQNVYARALMLLKSPKDCGYESGCTLLKLYCYWSKDDVPANQSSESTLSNESSESAPTNESRGNQLCEMLLAKYETMLVKIETDFLAVVLEDPMHGTLSGLKGLLLDKDSLVRLKFNHHQLERLLTALEKSTKKMLSILGGDAEVIQNPSFHDTACSIISIIQQSGLDGAKAVESEQLLLSAVWHNIKVCAKLAGGLVYYSPLHQEPQSNSPALSVDFVNRCADLLLRILMVCRHKGALEGTVEAFGILASKLVPSSEPAYSNIPNTILQRVFDHISTGSGSSVTRRSAGLPGLVQAVVAAESATNNGKLLKYVVDNLINLSSSMEDNEINDSTAGQALHILRGVVQDANVARCLGPHIQPIMQTCLDSFTSMNWSVRNAGLQLFGSLCPRILGQKKLRAEASEHNKIKLSELNTRFPGLLNILLTNLDTSAQQKTSLVCPSVVPILTLLSRLEQDQLSDQSGDHLMDQFKQRICVSVGCFLSSPALQVRHLAGRILAEFQSSSFLATLKLATKELNTNRQHGLLLILKNLSALSTAEDMTADSRTSIEQLLNELYAGSNCYVIKMICFDIQEALGARRQVEIKLGEEYHPGYHEHADQGDQDQKDDDQDQEDQDGEDQAPNRRPTGDQKVLARLQWILNDPQRLKKADKLVPNFLAHMFSTDGGIARAVLDIFNSKYWIEGRLIDEPDQALELLPIIVAEREKSPLILGSSTQLKDMLLISNCLNAMLIQDDWAWFFGDMSEYVPIFVQNSENILQLSSPSSVEDSRLSAAACLTALAPCMKHRSIRGSMTPILQYGFMNLIHAALTLLQDEDVEVRNAATNFAAQIKRSQLISQHEEINTSLGIENVIYYGLRELTEIIEIFSPINKLVNISRLSYNPEDYKFTTHVLFKKGDGINVYSEPVLLLKTTYTCIRKHIDETGDLNIRLTISEIVSVAEPFIQALESEELTVYPGYFTTPGFEGLLTLYILLRSSFIPGFLKHSAETDSDFENEEEEKENKKEKENIKEKEKEKEKEDLVQDLLKRIEVFLPKSFLE